MTAIDLEPGTSAGGDESFLERIGRQAGLTASARLAFGEPVERHEVTVIPVASVIWGFGGGSGSRPQEGGAGGGGGARVSPVGYIEIRDGATVFRPVWSPAAIVSVAAAGAVALAWLVQRLGR